MNGLLNVYKPPGMTSYDVVAKVKKELKIKKIGHTGTLDPMASGVLVLCLGKATKISQYITLSKKSYIGELTLGYKIDTQDQEGKVLKYSDNQVTDKEIIKVFNNFKGEIEQIPPMYSAVKFKGKKLYELAREGKIVKRDPRLVTIYNLEIIKIDQNKKILFYVECSSGTYIRTLCDDIGTKLGTYGYMSYLIRTKVGNFKIEDSIGVNVIENKNRDFIQKLVQPIDKALVNYPSIILRENYYNKVVNGAIVPIEDLNVKYNNTQLFKIYCKNYFLGIGKIIERDGKKLLKMVRVLV